MHYLSVGDRVRDQLAELGEVPSVPLATAHHVVVQLLVHVVDERAGLHHHRILLLGVELHLVSGVGSRHHLPHRLHVTGPLLPLQQLRQIVAHQAGQVRDGGIADTADRVLLLNGAN